MATDQTAAAVRPGPPLALVVAVVGGASLGGEIAATRLLAPWFGASTIVWANTIAVVLVGLSIGYWLGGRVADRDPTIRGLGKVLLLGAALMALVPFVAGPFLRVSVDALDSIEAGAFAGSLLGVLVLIAIPMVVLGTVAPYAIRLAVTSVDEAGRVSGRLYAISTLGSLGGVFLAALLLIPYAGTRRTFLVFAILIAIVGVWALSSRLAALVPVAVLALLIVPVGTVKATDRGAVIWEKETPYQYARVVEDPRDGERTLELNEGQAIHSPYTPGKWLTGRYWDELLVLPTLLRGTPPKSLAVLGNAGGTTARQYGHYFPDTRIDAVELDGELTDVARRYFDMRAPHLTTHEADARPFLRATDRRFDTIIVDAYRQPYIPFYLSTKEFFALVKKRLNPGGVVLVNVGHPAGNDDLEKVLTATMRTSFPTVLRDPSAKESTMLAGLTAPAPTTAPALPTDLVAVGNATAGRTAPGLDGGAVYTDDVAPVEWLIDASILHVAAEGHE
jgi:spermidine synthase